MLVLCSELELEPCLSVYPVAAAVDVERGSEKGDEEGKSKKPTCELSVKIEK